MRHLTNDQFNQLNANLGEFHEVAELHAVGELYQIEYYDSQVDGENVQYYIVVRFIVADPTEIMHVFDHVYARTRVALNAEATSHREVVTHQQDLQRVSMVAFERSSEALEYATRRISELVQQRCYA